MEMEDRESAGTDYVLAMLGALLLAAWFLPLDASNRLGQGLKYTTGISGAPHELLDDGEFLSAPPKGQNTTLTHSPGRISRDSSVRRAANEGHSSNKAFALELDPGAPTMERYISKPGATATPAPQATIWP
ncbi:uncharacterized protein CCOS01_00454 [Colletotrichum costaricense]|uniref:Uncharacterized protein n=1 Tax=Colletotrichum costaricense TaxID=1209916 RepID=A0AAI9ZAZ9_9PEZI|nr:uncharacterized protein CCOS01_00454 [Colletotrichum costaricense]KAK1539140.1 hypothetical protein CCOS01_00454 [Colletotrichum costaricense]